VSARKTTTRVVQSCILLGVALAVEGQAPAPSGRTAEWVTSGADAQRSQWIPNDAKISVEGLQKPGFQFLWKSKLDNDPVQLNSLMPAILMNRYIGYRGFRSFAFVAGSSNTIYALDSDLNKIEWQKRLELATPSSAGSIVCPGGITSPVARSITTAYPFSGNSGGRFSWARSDVGASGEGAVTLPAALRTAAAALAAASAPPAVPAATSTATTPPRPPTGPRPSLLYVIAGDGMLHVMNVSNGDEAAPPIPFLPPQSNAEGLIVIDNFAYAATHECNGVRAGLWALDLATRQVIHWSPATGDLAGSAGPAFGPDGTIYVPTTAGNLVALNSKTLDVKDSYSAGAEFTSSPVVLAYKGRNIIAAATRDGRIHLVDAASPGTPLSKTPPYSADFSPGALASWQSPTGERWLLAAAAGPWINPAFKRPVSVGGDVLHSEGPSASSGPITNGAVAAWKVVDHDGAIALDLGWVSRDLISPLPPMIINGVVFALSSGEYRSGDAAMTAALRIQRSSPAILYAMDGATGKTLWDSGKTITSFVYSGGLSGGASQLYLSTYDGTIYAFGFPIEH
jgi:outer membrane protein assembly factor BamB